MLAGRRPFAGSTNSELVQTIIHGAPEPLGEEIPVALRTVVEKALEKDPADRYQAMREIVVDLRRLTRRSAETPASPMTRPGATTGHFFSFILRHGWEFLHDRMCIWCVLLAYAAWRFRVAIPGVVGFAIFFAVLICTTVLSLLLSILLYTHVADKTHFAAEVRRMAPWIRFLSIVISLLAWVMAAIVAAPHILLAVFLTIMGTVLGVTVLTFKPSMERLALSSQDLN
jgi:hypothetical protein